MVFVDNKFTYFGADFFLKLLTFWYASTCLDHVLVVA